MKKHTRAPRRREPRRPPAQQPARHGGGHHRGLFTALRPPTAMSGWSSSTLEVHSGWLWKQGRLDGSVAGFSRRWFTLETRCSSHAKAAGETADPFRGTYTPGQHRNVTLHYFDKIDADTPKGSIPLVQVGRPGTHAAHHPHTRLAPSCPLRDI
jgi:hypothetical protein